MKWCETSFHAWYEDRNIPERTETWKCVLLRIKIKNKEVPGNPDQVSRGGLGVCSSCSFIPLWRSISPLSFISGLLFFSFILPRQWDVVALKRDWISSWKSAMTAIWRQGMLSIPSTFTKVCLRLPLDFCVVQTLSEISVCHVLTITRTIGLLFQERISKPSKIIWFLSLSLILLLFQKGKGHVSLPTAKFV